MEKEIFETTLNTKQKRYILNNLCEDEDLYIFYKSKMKAKWVITNDENKDPIYDDRYNDFYAKGEEYPFPYVLIIDNEFTDALGKDFVKNLIKGE